MANYELRHSLSRAADADFENIFNFGIDRFGLNQAIKYQDGMKQSFQELAEQPKLYPAVDHIRTGYRRSVRLTLNLLPDG